MSSNSAKLLLFVAWPAAVFLAAFAIGVASTPYWMVVACVAIVPPWVARHFWHAPEQTVSESIQNARR